MIEPIELPSANPKLPRIADKVEAENSGKVVPRETIVAPITISGTFNIFESFTALSTRKSADLDKRYKETNKIIAITTIFNGINNSSISKPFLSAFLGLPLRSRNKKMGSLYKKTSHPKSLNLTVIAVR